VDTYDDLDEVIESAADHAVRHSMAIVVLRRDGGGLVTVVPDVVLVELTRTAHTLRAERSCTGPVVARCSLSLRPRNSPCFEGCGEIPVYFLPLHVPLVGPFSTIRPSKNSVSEPAPTCRTIRWVLQFQAVGSI
jgi:hypothetical protein